MTVRLLYVSLTTLAVCVVSGCQAQTDVNRRTVISTPTLGQVFGAASQPTVMQYARAPISYSSIAAIAPAGDQRTVRGHVVKVVHETPLSHAVLVDGRPIIRDTEDSIVGIQGVYEGGGRAYVLVGEASGGNACPSMYQAIDLSGPVPVVSPQFGNCSDLPRVGIVGGALRATFGSIRAARAVTYTIKDGRLSH